MFYNDWIKFAQNIDDKKDYSNIFTIVNVYSAMKESRTKILSLI